MANKKKNRAAVKNTESSGTKNQTAGPRPDTGSSASQSQSPASAKNSNADGNPPQTNSKSAATAKSAASRESSRSKSPSAGKSMGRNAASYTLKPKRKAHNLLEWITLIPLMFPLAIIPLIMYLYPYEEIGTGLEQYPWVPEIPNGADFFLYYKQWTFVGIVGVMLVFLIIRAFIKSRPLTFIPAFVPLGIYALLSLISTLASKYRSFGLAGSFEHYENVFCLIGYGIVVYYAFLFVEDELDLKVLLISLSVGMLIMTTLGALQTFHFDLFRTDFGKQLFLPKEEWFDLESRYTLNFPEGTAFMTLYNPNYVGVYASLTAPLLAVLILLAKPVWLKVLNAVDFILVLICLYGSGSKAGLIGLAAAFLFVIVFLRKFLIKRLYITVPIVVLIAAGVLIGGRGLISRVAGALKVEPSVSNITNIETNDEDVLIEFKGNTLHINIFADASNFYGFYFYDGDNAEVPFTVADDDMTYTITDERFSGFTAVPVLYDDLMSFRVSIDGHDWYFTNQYEEGTYYYITAYGRPDKIVMAEEGPFGDYENFASGRGYLWSRTIPLLKNYIVLGSGADSFVQVFPQQDYVGKVNNHYDEQIITKPHSMYLQIGVQTGVLSLLAFLVFYAFYFFNSIALYIKGKFDTFASQAGLAIFTGTIGYMVCGISNDSMIVVSPVFWTLLGIGFAANAMVMKENKRNKALEAEKKEQAA